MTVPMQIPPAGPPAGVAASDLCTRLAQESRPTAAVDFPRKSPDGTPYPQIHIRVLRQAEIMTAMAGAEGYAREMLKEQKGPSDSHGYHDLYTDAKVCELLWFACRKEDGAPAFINSKSLRNLLTADEMAVLFNAYMDWQAASGPLISSMDEAEMDAWIDRLKEGLSRLPLPQHSLEARTDLLMRSIARLRKSETASTSSGEPQSNSLENPSQPEVESAELPAAPTVDT